MNQVTGPSDFMKFICSIVAFCFLSLSFSVFAAEEFDDGGFDDRPIITIDNKKDIKIVYDAKTNEWAAGIGKALFYVRGLYEAYRKQGVEPEDLTVSVVLHGPTVYWLLTDEAFQAYTHNPFGINPNHHVVESLVELGVSIEACNSTMKSMGWFGEDLLPGVNIVHDGYTRMVDLQMKGYTYIHF
ncbi:MAG: DsrE family protein [Thiotrichales bacterium]